MIIWSGWGFMVPVVAFGSLLATEAGVEAAFQDDNYYQSHGWPKLVGLLAAAFFVWLIDLWLKKRPRRKLVDIETGEHVSVGGGDSFFFIPVKWWAPILIVCGVIFSFVVE